MAAKKKTAKAKTDPAALVAAALAAHDFPKSGGPGLGFTKEDDALFQRGYPFLRFVSDEAVGDVAAFEAAEEALDAVDPSFRMTIPRTVARLYLLGHSVGTCLFPDTHGPAGPANAQLRIARADRMRSDRAIDLALLDEALGRSGVAMGDIYSRWRWPKVLFLYEEFLGTEPVARSLVRHLVREADDLSRWGFSGKNPLRVNAAPHYLALALPWLFKRLPENAVHELRVELARASPPSDAAEEPRAYRALLKLLAGEPVADEMRRLFAFELALSGDDRDELERRVDEGPHNFMWWPGPIAWRLGTARFARAMNVSAYNLPRMIDSVAPLRDAGVVRLVARVGSQRVGKKAAAEWLRDHADYARPILDTLAALPDDKEAKCARVALELLSAKAPKETPLPTEEALDAEIAAIFEDLKKRLARLKDEEKQREAVRAAHERYTEACAAAGHPVPEAYFTHYFADFGLGEWGERAADWLG